MILECLAEDQLMKNYSSINQDADQRVVPMSIVERK
jgi:hypothetical protein